MHWKGGHLRMKNGAFIREKVLENLNKVIVGKEETCLLLLTALLADGHVLLEDVPGTGKTKRKRWQKHWMHSFPGFSSRRIYFPRILPA